MTFLSIGLLIFVVLLVVITCQAVQVNSIKKLAIERLRCSEMAESNAASHYRNFTDLQVAIRHLEKQNRLLDERLEQSISRNNEHLDQLVKNRVELERSDANWQKYIDRYTQLAKASTELQEALDMMYNDNILPRLHGSEDPLDDGGY